MSFESFICTIDSGLQEIVKFLLDIMSLPKPAEIVESQHQHTLIFDSETSKWIIAQQFSWDCGLACLSMLLKWQEREYAHIYSSHYAALARPLWTIDIFLLLYNEDVNIEMFTTSLGVQSHYHDFDWYSQFMADDVNRVNAGFLEAAEKHHPVFQRSLSIETIKSIIKRQKCIAILLVNSIIINEKSASINYVGHYIVIIDYISEANQFIYLDPAKANEARLVAADLLDNARRHPGTDEDIIFCFKDRSASLINLL